ncbi:hypothetical protein EMIHUDRAFT_232097 [Emiliania huxleyi CCMP1516]|uniref:Tudor domain-containing protein n=2 Tax=Emiliania huxleyi TaxID=2903 RepID=A0A0D3K6D1_EMIH1|nr:hypothetical protein EMIHUDRAFT_232097 [Emiliania huxleyi CCMP1516]EOD31316.1 hypothetical protein EMIHUDRAFT_232097 [Emiliania huxleyi CCMP1516]|eukprot:XP_005783745.1 hypothetical protein EMIHUDRAFT_232097 [Emiliania huxleyi CCMP1516]
MVILATAALVVPVLVSSPTPGAEPVPVGEGDAVLCKDQASQAWWRATVRQTRGDQLLVHYMGCDDAWDEWFDASSPDICAVDAQEAARGAFQSEEAELELEGMGDEEILEAYRAQKWANNARWQLATFAQAQLGEWKGSCLLWREARDARADAVGGHRRGRQRMGSGMYE